MKKKITTFCLLFCLFSVFSQSEKKQITNFSNSLCSCIEKESGTLREVLKKCTLKILTKDPSLIKIATNIADKKGNINEAYWSKINLKLASSCDTYNILLMESFIDKNQKFQPVIIGIGNQICKKLKPLNNVSEKDINRIVIPLLKKNQKKLLKTFSSPGAVMKNLNHYLALNCKKYRTYYSLSSAKKSN
ncbi:MAG: hypothetical protein HWD85_03685 [Flavobacteriaceae bacterium]|nr:hypothetical protein [Flavobacteriaceae bacterium]